MKDKKISVRIEKEKYYLLKDITKDLHETTSQFVYKAIMERLEYLGFISNRLKGGVKRK
tara:strand:+ start:52 stop:228 length:177 start_codon:yes stop_codon:yes gene_type:complete